MFAGVEKGGSSFRLVNDQANQGGTMNQRLLYQWEQLMSGHLPSLNSWQRANVALLSYGVMKAESCQQRQVAKAVSCGERVESAARRWRRFV
jgi:hypothetical protein